MSYPLHPNGTATASTLNRSIIRDVAIIFAGSLLVGLSAHAKVFLPFTPVPVTAQTLTVLLLGATLGSRRGTGAVLLYLAWGASGLPVFAAASAPFWKSPSGGYLIGFVAAAFVTGWLAEHGLDRGLKLVPALAAGNAIIYAIGLPWLATFLAASAPDNLMRTTLAAGLVPFLPGDAVKLVAAALAAPSGRRLMKWQRR